MKNITPTLIENELYAIGAVAHAWNAHRNSEKLNDVQGSQEFNRNVESVMDEVWEEIATPIVEETHERERQARERRSI